MELKKKKKEDKKNKQTGATFSNTILCCQKTQKPWTDPEAVQQGCSLYVVAKARTVLDSGAGFKTKVKLTDKESG